jgi:hypothetical protein
VSDGSKLTSSHLRRQAFVYAHQSSKAQVEHNVQSAALQYALVERAIELGFTREQVVVIESRRQEPTRRFDTEHAGLPCQI